MPRREWLLIILTAGTAMTVVSVAAIVPVPHRTMDESLSLTGALNAISRKQRSLDAASQSYDFNYHGAHPDRDPKINKERQAEREIDGENEQIEFLPNVVGQLETVENGFQDLNDKMRERALIEYLEGVLQQEEPITSQFRERERGVGRKRNGGSDRINFGNKQLAKLFLEQQEESPYSIGDENEDEDGNGEENGDENGNGDGNGEGYTNAREMLYDRYMINRGSNKDFENAGPMSWGELLNKESLNKESLMRDQNTEVDDNEITDRDLDPNLLYLSLAERKTMNGGYPGSRDYRTYRNVAKRFPVAKRSPQPLPPKKQLTDPKVAQDLGSLFGTQPCHDHDHDHDHDHAHAHDQDHNHDHDQDHNHDHDHDRKQQKPEGSTEAPKANLPVKSQKDNVAKNDKSKPIDVRKKSIDWSQYFGIDRRRKKAASSMPDLGNQIKNNNWRLKQYFENMANNLRGTNPGYKKETFILNDMHNRDRLNAWLDSIRNVIFEDALRHTYTSDKACIEKSRDTMMLRLKALNDLRISLEDYDPINETSNFRENSNFSSLRDKRNDGSEGSYGSNGSDSGDDDDDQTAEGGGMTPTDRFHRSPKYKGVYGVGDGDVNGGDPDAAVCPVGRELKEIQEWCGFVVSMLDGDDSQILYSPCIMLQTCHTCFQTQDGPKKMCLVNHLLKAKEICGAHPQKNQKMSCFEAVVFFAGKKYNLAR